MPYRLGPGDMLTSRPVGRTRSRMSADGMARFIDVAGRVDDWPPRMLYADGTEISSGSLNQLFN